VRAFEDFQRAPALPIAATETVVVARGSLEAIEASANKAEAREAAIAAQKAGVDPHAVKTAYAKRIAELS
jgi:hypothetical protein